MIHEKMTLAILDKQEPQIDNESMVFRHMKSFCPLTVNVRRMQAVLKNHVTFAVTRDQANRSVPRYCHLTRLLHSHQNAS